MINSRAGNNAPGRAVPVQGKSKGVKIGILGITNRPDVVSRDDTNRLQNIGEPGNVRAGNNIPRCAVPVLDHRAISAADGCLANRPDVICRHDAHAVE